MRPNAYRTLARNEEQGWYYEARRRAIARLIDEYVLDDDHESLRLLDVGCGTGGTTEFLSNFGQVTGVEPSPLAIELLRKNHPDIPVIHGGVDDLSKLLPAHEFDLATLLGVLVCRAVNDPLSALCHVRRALKPGGWLIWNEATYPFLARQHDNFVEASRRFYPREMKRLLIDAGFEVVHAAPLLGWGFPVALSLAGIYRLRRLFGSTEKLADEQDASDDRPLPEWLNDLLVRWTYGEWSLSMSGVRMPCGVAQLILARKPKVQRVPLTVPVRHAA